MCSDHEAHEDRCDDGSYAYTVGQYVEAASIFASLVEIKCDPAAVGLADMYLRGEGVAVDLERGLDLYRTAAQWGNAIAAFSLGALHRSGDCGVPRLPALSRKYFLLAKNLGCRLSVDDYL